MHCDNDPARNMTPDEQAAHWGERIRNAAKQPTPGAIKAAEMIAPARPSRLTAAEYEWGEKVRRDARAIDEALGLPEMIAALEAAIPYIEQAYECAFPDPAENESVLVDAKSALARLKGEQ